MMMFCRGWVEGGRGLSLLCFLFGPRGSSLKGCWCWCCCCSLAAAREARRQACVPHFFWRSTIALHFASQLFLNCRGDGGGGSAHKCFSARTRPHTHMCTHTWRQTLSDQSRPIFWPAAAAFCFVCVCRAFFLGRRVPIKHTWKDHHNTNNTRARAQL